MPDSGLAVNSGAVQEVRGMLGQDDHIIYRIPKLKRGQTLYVFVEGKAGILDPFAALLKKEVNAESVYNDYLAPLENVVEAGQDPLLSVTETFEKVSLIWNDDYRGGHNAGFLYKIEAAGAYHLLVMSAISLRTSGEYRLMVGVNVPAVLQGKARPAGKPFLIMTQGQQGEKAISSARGTISKGRDFRFHPLHDMAAEQTLYVYVEATSGGLKPVVTLLDSSDKPIITANYYGKESKAVMKYRFERPAKNFTFRISGRQADGSVTEGDYSLLAGLGAPEVMLGTGGITSRSVLKRPIPVSVGLKMHQITGVDQKNENFTVVATLFMKWQDPTLAFNPDEAGERARIYRGDDFNRGRAEEGKMWPEFTIFNQQGNRWAQNKSVAVFPDGRALYLEQFTATLQAPDFDFRSFPFDRQQFFIRIDSLFPEWIVLFEPLGEYSEVGEHLGEEEWLVSSFDTGISVAETAGRPVSRFSFRFEAKRHLEYYIFRILLPILIILIVSWVIFFLKDYSKRIDVAGGNLLLFIAFNFTISNELPHLGYLTFMDAIMISAFMVTALVLILSVFLKRMSEEGKEELAQNIDRYVVRWLYPVGYIGSVTAVVMIFG